MLTDIGTTLVALAGNLGTLVYLLFLLATSLALWLIWVAVWLFAVNWKHLWPVLGRGGWAVVVLMGVMAAFVWSQIDPTGCDYCGLPNFWRQLGEVGMLVAIALVCGHLQSIFRCGPPEMSFDPPPHEHIHAGHDLTEHSHAPAHH
jgi:hypothetical protein